MNIEHVLNGRGLPRPHDNTMAARAVTPDDFGRGPVKGRARREDAAFDDRLQTSLAQARERDDRPSTVDAGPPARPADDPLEAEPVEGRPHDCEAAVGNQVSHGDTTAAAAPADESAPSTEGTTGETSAAALGCASPVATPTTTLNTAAATTAASAGDSPVDPTIASDAFAGDATAAGEIDGTGITNAQASDIREAPPDPHSRGSSRTTAAPIDAAAMGSDSDHTSDGVTNVDSSDSGVATTEFEPAVAREHEGGGLNRRDQMVAEQATRGSGAAVALSADQSGSATGQDTRGDGRSSDQPFATGAQTPERLELGELRHATTATDSQVAASTDLRAAVPASAGSMLGTLASSSYAEIGGTQPGAASSFAGTPAADTPDRLVQSLRLQFQRGGGDATVQIKPEHLGPLTVSLRVENGSVAARIIADNPVVVEWLQANEQTLRESLKASGLHLDRLVIQRDPDPSSRTPQRESPSSRRDQRRQATDRQSTFEITV